MSAVYLHNSIYHSRDISTEDRSNFPHSRNLSTVSSATLLTNTTHHSQPNEPLLPHSTSPQESDYDVVSRNTIPRYPSKREHPFQDNSAATRQERGLLSTLRRRPLRGMMRWLKTGLDFLIAVWGLYNAIRYFLAFTVYDSVRGETVALALGVSAGLSFAFLACAIAFSVFRPQLLRHGVSYNTLSTVYWCLTYLSILLLFAPAATNFALVFLWRNASDLQLQPRHRCYVDIDLVWSRSSQKMCKTNTAAWGVWVALASVRLAITSAVLLGYQVVLYKLSEAPDILAKAFRGRHRVNPSDLFSSPYDSVLPGPQPATSVPFPAAPSPMIQSQGTRFQSSSSLSSRTKFSTQTHQPKLSRSRSSGLSTEARSPSDAVHLPSVPEGDGDIAGASTSRPTSTGFFSSVMTQIDREMEAALDFARSEGTPSVKSKRTVENHPVGQGDEDGSEDGSEENPVYVQRHPSNGSARRSGSGHSHHDNDGHDQDDGHDGDTEDDDDFYRGRGSEGMSVSLSTLGYNEFGQPYPPDMDIPMMNGYIRRMPTIESMGSREMGSSIAGSSLMSGRGGGGAYGDKRGSMQSQKSGKRSSYGSRPGTRSAMRESWAGSEMLGVPVFESEQESPRGGGERGSGSGSGVADTSRESGGFVQAERLSALSALDGNGSARSSDFRARAREATEMGEMLDKMMDELLAGGAGGMLRDSNGGESVSSKEMGVLDGAHQQARYSSSTNGSRSTDKSFFTAKTGSAKSRDSSVPPAPPSPSRP